MRISQFTVCVMSVWKQQYEYSYCCFYTMKLSVLSYYRAHILNFIMYKNNENKYLNVFSEEAKYKNGIPGPEARVCHGEDSGKK